MKALNLSCLSNLLSLSGLKCFTLFGHFFDGHFSDLTGK